MPIIMSVWINILHVRTLFVFSSSTVATFSALCFSVYRLFTDFALWSTQRNFNSLLSILHYYVSSFFMSVFHFFLPTYLSIYLPTHQQTTNTPAYTPSHPPPYPALSITSRVYGVYGKEGRKRSYLRNAMQSPKHDKIQILFSLFFSTFLFLFFSFYYISCMEKANLRRLYKGPIRSMLCSWILLRRRTFLDSSGGRNYAI